MKSILILKLMCLITLRCAELKTSLKSEMVNTNTTPYMILINQVTDRIFIVSTCFYFYSHPSTILLSYTSANILYIIFHRYLEVYLVLMMNYDFVIAALIIMYLAMGIKTLYKIISHQIKENIQVNKDIFEREENEFSLIAWLSQANLPQFIQYFSTIFFTNCIKNIRNSDIKIMGQYALLSQIFACIIAGVLLIILGYSLKYKLKKRTCLFFTSIYYIFLSTEMLLFLYGGINH